jgi:RNA-binding protein 39
MLMYLQLRVNTVHEKGTARYTQQDTLDEAGGGNLNAASRQALMQKLARTQPANLSPEPVAKPVFSQSMQSRSVLLKNMFNPEEYVVLFFYEHVLIPFVFLKGK